MKVYTPSDMRKADKYAIEVLDIPGTVLMDNAAGALFDSLSDYIGKGKKFVILCGKGNNGGDGYALALRLRDTFENVVCISVFGDVPKTEDALYFYELCQKKSIAIIDCERDFDVASEKITDADVITDAIFGTGFSGEIKKDSICARIIELSNSNPAYRLSADIPSGIDAEYGSASAISFCAHRTVSFAKGKPGMYSYGARELCGEIEIAEIGISDSVFENFNTKYEVSDKKLILSSLPARHQNSSKGSYGKLLIIAGSKDMPGAAHLACLGALRMGAGLVCLASEDSVLNIIKGRLSEPVYLPVVDTDEDTQKLIEYAKSCSAVLIGCGLGTGERVTKRVCELIRSISVPIILDADGINAISGNINVLSEAKCNIVLTPHPLEFSRISGLSVSEIQKNRIKSALDFSLKHSCTLLLKGAGTVIAEKGERVTINTSGNSALSKGGSGDVLAGMIASLLAQGASCGDAAVCGAYLHGLAGDALSEELSQYGVLPSEIPERAARILADILK